MVRSVIETELHNVGVDNTDGHDNHDRNRTRDGTFDFAPTCDVSLSERAHDEIEHRIATCEFAPGEAISEKALSSALDIGRTPIREALQRLSREGMVRVLPRRCVRVSTIDTRSQRRLLELRREIARFVARAVAINATDRERSALGDVASKMAAAVERHDELDFMSLDGAFDRLMGRATHNVFASRTLDLTSGLLRRLWFVHRSNGTQDLETMVRHRAALASAIQERDPLAAGAASDALLDYLESFADQGERPKAATRRRSRGQPKRCGANDAPRGLSQTNMA